MPITVEVPVADDLYRLRDALVVETANTATVAFDARRLGAINIVRGRSTVRLRVGEFALTPSVGYSEIAAQTPGFAIPFDKEIDAGLRVDWATARGSLSALAAANTRDGDTTAVHGQCNWQATISPQLRYDASLWINEVVDDTPLLRVLGTKDKFALGIGGEPTRFDSWRLVIDGHRYRTRAGEPLAEGYRLDGTAEHTIFRHGPQWSVRLQGSWESNNVVAQLPSSAVNNYLLRAPLSLASVVADEFGTLGAGTTLRLGAPEGLAWGPFLLAEAWIGVLWPSSTLAYSTSVGVGMSFFRRDKLSVNVFHANTQGGQANSAYEGVGITYNYLF